MGWGGPRTCTPNPDPCLEPVPASCVRVALPPPRVDRSELNSPYPPPEPAHLHRPTGLGKPVRELRSRRPSSRTQVREGWVRGYGVGRAGSGEQVRADQFRDAGSRRSARAIRFRVLGPSRPAQADPTPPNRTRSPNPTPSPT